MANKLLKNKVYVKGTLEAIDLQQHIFSADHPTCAGRTAVKGSIVVNVSEEGDKVSNLITVPVFAMNPVPSEKTGEINEYVQNNYNALKDFMEHPDNNIGRQVNISTQFNSNIFVDKNTGDLVENVKLGSPFLNQVKPNSKNQAMFTGTVLIDKEPIPMVDRDENPILSENGLPKYRMTIKVFDTYKGIMFPMDVVLEEPGAQWAESVYESKDIYTVNINLISETYEEEKEIEGAFGTPQIVKTKYTRNERLLYWANPEPVDIEDKDELLAEYGKKYAQELDKQKNNKALEEEKQSAPKTTKPVEKETSTVEEEDMDFDW